MTFTYVPSLRKKVNLLNHYLDQNSPLEIRQHFGLSDGKWNYLCQKRIGLEPGVFISDLVLDLAVFLNISQEALLLPYHQFSEYVEIRSKAIEFVKKHVHTYFELACELISQQLMSPSNCAISIYGASGLGKTELAINIACAMQGSHFRTIILDAPQSQSEIVHWVTNLQSKVRSEESDGIGKKHLIIVVDDVSILDGVVLQALATQLKTSSQKRLSLKLLMTSCAHLDLSKMGANFEIKTIKLGVMSKKRCVEMFGSAIASHLEQNKTSSIVSRDIFRLKKIFSKLIKGLRPTAVEIDCLCSLLVVEGESLLERWFNTDYDEDRQAALYRDFIVPHVYDRFRTRISSEHSANLSQQVFERQIWLLLLDGRPTEMLARAIGLETLFFTLIDYRLITRRNSPKRYNSHKLTDSYKPHGLLANYFVKRDDDQSFSEGTWFAILRYNLFQLTQTDTGLMHTNVSYAINAFNWLEARSLEGVMLIAEHLIWSLLDQNVSVLDKFLEYLNYLKTNNFSNEKIQSLYELCCDLYTIHSSGVEQSIDFLPIVKNIFSRIKSDDGDVSDYKIGVVDLLHLFATKTVLTRASTVRNAIEFNKLGEFIKATKIVLGRLGVLLNNKEISSGLIPTLSRVTLIVLFNISYFDALSWFKYNQKHAKNESVAGLELYPPYLVATHIAKIFGIPTPTLQTDIEAWEEQVNEASAEFLHQTKEYAKSRIGCSEEIVNGVYVQSKLELGAKYLCALTSDPEMTASVEQLLSAGLPYSAANIYLLLIVNRNNQIGDIKLEILRAANHLVGYEHQFGLCELLIRASKLHVLDGGDSNWLNLREQFGENISCSRLLAHWERWLQLNYDEKAETANARLPTFAFDTEYMDQLTANATNLVELMPDLFKRQD